jgi:hypothetical protein
LQRLARCAQGGAVNQFGRAQLFQMRGFGQPPGRGMYFESEAGQQGDANTADAAIGAGDQHRTR